MSVMNIRHICIVCPRECEIDVGLAEQTVTEVTGHACERGKDFAVQETLSPSRIVTTTVPVRGGVIKRLPVRSAKPIPKGMIQAWMNAVKELRPEAPISAGEVLILNILGTGTDVISSRSAERSDDFPLF